MEEIYNYMQILMEGDCMKEKFRYILTSGFAKVAAWVIFIFCATLMLFRKNRHKEIENK